MWLPDSRYDEPAKIAAAFRDVLERLETISGVESSSAVLGVPLSGTAANFGITVEGRPEPLPGEELSAGFQPVAPGYFRTMGIPLLRGRDLALTDDDDAPMVAVVSTTAVERFWPSEDPIGKRFTQDGEDWFEVVGIVSDVLHNGPRPGTARRGLRLVPASAFSVHDARAQKSRRARSADRTRSARDPRHRPGASYLQSDAAVGSHLGLGGRDALSTRFYSAASSPRPRSSWPPSALYGLMAYSVSQRQREIGIRVALGAETRDILGLVVREGMFLTLSGLAIGLVTAFAASRFLEALLFNITTTDAATYGAVAIVLLAVGPRCEHRSGATRGPG